MYVAHVIKVLHKSFDHIQMEKWARDDIQATFPPSAIQAESVPVKIWFDEQRQKAANCREFDWSATGKKNRNQAINLAVSSLHLYG